MALILRDVELGDVDAYFAMRCDPVMMADLGGPLPRDGIAAKVERDVTAASNDESWILMIVPDENDLTTVAGSLFLWMHEQNGETISEIGWMVLPKFQGRGLGKSGVRILLKQARDDGRWGIIHAFPVTTSGASNGICRSLGFTLLGQQDVQFADRTLKSNHWVIEPALALLD